MGGWLDGWVGVEIEVNANSAPNLVGVGAGAELGKTTIVIQIISFNTASLSRLYGYS